MSLQAGTRLGPYEILAPLGAGGMGEVYRARDTRLDRIVAVKVLPSHLSASAEIRARFEREARAISSLNHPHICTLHDVGHGEGLDFLVMEHIEGESLAARLQRGPMPAAELLRFAIQIADALDKAHRSGIAHRDLKPANIMLTKAGAKLLDFGLARPTGTGAAPAGLSHSPTMTRPLTAEGSIVGTFQYMAPEQLEGKEADARTDIFAFGAVLYEMATGARAFSGASQASLITAIMSADPAPMAAAAPLSPPALERAVRVCLAKDPDDRFQTAHDLRLQLEWISEAGPQAPAADHAGRAASVRWARAVAAASLLLAAFLAAAVMLRKEEPRRKVIASIEAPDRAPLSLDSGPMALSPDGRFLALVARGPEGKNLLWVRALDEIEPKPIAGTEGATCPFWSPDARSIGFFALGKLKKVELAGGRPEDVASARRCQGASWGADGSILFVPDYFSPVMRIPKGGGQPAAVTAMGPGNVSFAWPAFLPDGRHFLYTMNAADTAGDVERGGGIFVGSIDAMDGARRVAPTLSNARYAAGGFLVYAKDGALRAQRFDLDRLDVEGEPIALAEKVQYLPAFGSYLFSVSDNGLLAYLAGAGAEKTHLAWFDRAGARVEDLPITALIYVPRLSRDGRRVAFDQSDPITDSGDIWIHDFNRKISDRITFDAANESWPIWSGDDRRVLFFRNVSGRGDLFVVASDGTGAADLLLTDDARKRPTDWSRDGRYVVFESILPESKTGADLWLLDVEKRKAEPWLATPFTETDARFSPDGRYLAYRSDESGRTEVYLRALSTGAGKWRVSADGGSSPRWRADGEELFYVSPDQRLMSVSISWEAEPATSAPVALFEAPRLLNSGDSAHYDVSPDGRRFLLDLRAGAPDRAAITLVSGWAEGAAGR